MDLTGRDVFAGLDLSETRDLTALVLVGADIVTGIWHVEPVCWLPQEGLCDKARSDRIPYDRWAKEGCLETTPGVTISYEYIARYLRGVFDRYRVQKIAFDRWNMQHLQSWLLTACFSEQMIKDKFVPFDQGFKDMSPALRALEEVILERKLRHGGNPCLAMCAANAVVDRDPAGNRKLNKKRASGRIDGLIALAMAVGVAPMRSAAIDVSTLIF
jgi:phage terminase large subunit-like protein